MNEIDIFSSATTILQKRLASVTESLKAVRNDSQTQETRDALTSVITLLIPLVSDAV